MSYTGFGGWRRIALRLIHDDEPLSQVFFSVPRDVRFAPYNPSLMDAAHEVRASPVPLVIPCMALLLVKQSTKILTHAVMLITDGKRVRLFDPNGRYRAPLQYFVRGLAISSDDIADFLKRACGSPLPWSRSFQGIQSTIKETPHTKFIPNRGYCMFLCRALLDYLAEVAEKDGSNFIPLVQGFERKECMENQMGPAAKGVLQQKWPDPSNY